MMWQTSFVREVLHTAHYFGFGDPSTKVNWAHIKDSRDAYVKKLNGIYARNLEKSSVNTVEGEAAFIGPRTVECNGTTYTADHVLIGVGGEPTIASVPGFREHCITSDGFFELEEQPKRVGVIGTGYIGVEIAGVLNGLGSEVTIFSRTDYILRPFDDMLRSELALQMETAGVTILKNQSVAAVTKDEASGELTVVDKDGRQTGPFDAVLVAVGRKPVTAGLGLDKAGVNVLPSGHIEIDDLHCTSTTNTYAVGDCVRRIDLTPVAIAAGRLLVDRIFGGRATAKMDYDCVPTVVFSHPAIGTCGLTEVQAREKYGDDNITTVESSWYNLSSAMWKGVGGPGKSKSKAKLVCLGEEKKIVGLHIIGEGADEMLQGFGVAMRMGATKYDFDSCVAIHPTASEEIVTMAPWTHRSMLGNEPGSGGAGGPSSAL